MLTRLGLRLRIMLIFAGLAAGMVGALVLGLWAAGARTGVAAGTLAQAGVIAAFLSGGLVAWVWYLFDTNVARPILSLAVALRARAHADAGGAIDTEIGRYLGDLAPAATAAAQRLAETRTALAESVARETARLSDEKRRLETLLSDVPVGVLLCSADHQVVFYNGQAVDLLGVAAGPGADVGLDRRVFEYLREGPITHAYRRLVAAGDADAVSSLMCATVGGGRALGARMRLVQADGGRPGYVLTLRDMTADLAAHARLDALTGEILDRVRRPAANLKAVTDAAQPGAPLPPAFETALRAEVARLAAAVTELGARYEDGRGDAWPPLTARASDLADGLRARLGAEGIVAGADAAELLLRCNGFDVIALLGGIAGRMAGQMADVRIAIEEEATGAMIRLTWTGAAASVGQIDGWLAEPLDPAQPDVPRRAVLAAHATELWPQTGADGRRALCLPIRQARRAGPRPAPIQRAVVYDFDLLARARSDRVADMRLADLTCVVFDTETTGLLPRQGDELVQIAAVRLVNGRRIEGEVLDTLVNPGRPIPPASTEVHGITDAMVAGAPDVATAVRRFHAFCAGAVLVAHNAPFDMEFLRRQEGALGLRFDNPILDTVLLSAVVWGTTEVHTLDALSHRLGIVIPEEARHTAIGDALATADAFLKLVPLLRARGHETFGDVLTEVRRHGRLLRDLNPADPAGLAKGGGPG